MFNPDQSVFIIAEAGVNHNGSVSLARDLVDVAVASGADAVKFQTFDPAAMTTQSAPKADYQKKNTGSVESQREMLNRLVLEKTTYRELKRYAEKSGLHFLSTAFDSKSLNFLSEDLDLKILKIASGEITNGPLLLEFALTNAQLILSTGMSSEHEVRDALAVLAFGYVGEGLPTPSSFSAAMDSDEGQTALREKLTLLHCTTQYPAPYDGVNLRAINTLKEEFQVRVGYSDHTLGTVVAPSAVASGARVIEKHITLDKALDGPDHLASLEPNEFKEMVEAIRLVESALGDGRKMPHPCEIENRAVARKSLVATRDISRGSELQASDLTAKRARFGISPMEFWSLVGTQAKKDFEFDEPF